MNIKYEDFLTRHIILYSKGHYKRTDDIMADLKLMMANSSGCLIDYYTDKEVFSRVAFCFVESCTRKNDVLEALECIYKRPYCMGDGPASIEEVMRYMIGKMSIIQVKKQVGDEYIDLIELGEPNPEYLPLPNKRT